MRKYIAVKILILALSIYSFSNNKNKEIAENYQCKSIAPQILVSEVQSKFSGIDGVNISDSSIIKVTQWGERKDQFIIHIYNLTQKCHDTLSAYNMEILSVIIYDSISKSFSVKATITKPLSEVNLFTTKLSSDYDESMFEFGKCDKLVKFDFAPYKIDGAVSSFGIRTGHWVGYGGGGAYSEMLHLFHVVNGRLLKVVSTLISHESSLAGDWYPDGTRGRDDNEQKWILIIGTEEHFGYYDLILKEIGKKNSKLILEWNKKEQMYFKKEPKGL